MDFEMIKRNLSNAFSQLMVLRMIVTSPSEKVADLPVLYVLVALLLAPVPVVATAVLGLLFRYAVRFEKDAVVR